MGFLDAFFLLLIFVPLLLVWGFSIWDIFARPDLSGWKKAFWFIGVLLFPFLGTFIYLLFRPSAVTPEQKRAESAAREAYTSSLAASELERLASLHSQGKLTDEEYVVAKAKLLSGTLPERRPPPAGKPPEQPPATH